MSELCSMVIPSEDYADFIIYYTGLRQRIEQMYPDNCLLFPTSEYFFYYEKIANGELSPEQAFSYFSIPKLYAPLDTTSMESSGITQNQNNPLLNLTGKGVLIGFMDSGIDWKNPVFLGEDQNTRILRIWDQTISPDTQSDFSSPSLFPYGTEYYHDSIQAALRGEIPDLPTKDETGHGTFAAAIAGGRQLPDIPFTGAAPNVFIAMVKLKQAKQYLRRFFRVPENTPAYQENDLIAAAIYLTTLARQENLPLVLCITTGTSSGSHDGTSPFCRVLEEISKQIGCIVVSAAGNETGRAHHYMGKLDQSSPSETVNLRVGERESGFTLELWSNLPERYAIRFTTPSGESLQNIFSYSREEQRLTFRLDPTIIYLSYHETESGTGNVMVLMRFYNPSAGVWRIQVENTLFLSGVYHMWLPVTGFIQENTGFLRPDPDVTITEPGNTASLITSSTYNHVNNSLYIHSSRGYTRSGRIKPDLAAPGVDVFGPVPSINTDLRFSRRTGACVAAAHTAGACANLLEWGLIRRNSPSMNSIIAKSILIRGAKRNPVYSYPNREVGYGTLDLYQSLLL